MKLLASLLLVAAPLQAQRWEPIQLGTAGGFRGLSVASDGVLWASGAQATVLRSLDGGKHWERSTVVDGNEKEKLDLRAIHGFDKEHAIAMSAGPAEQGSARLFRTDDGGKRWSLLFAEETPGVFFDAMAFWDRQHGLLLSDPVGGVFVLFTTDDGGAHWSRVPAAALPPALAQEGAFAASNQCLTVQGASEAWFVTGGAAVARVFRSADRGRSWSVAAAPVKPLNASSGLFAIAMRDALHGVAVGGDYKQPQESALANVVTTSDGGRSWSAAAATIPAGRFLSTVAFAGSGALIAGGTTGLIAAESSAGPWTQVSEQSVNALSSAGWAVTPTAGAPLLHRTRER